MAIGSTAEVDDSHPKSSKWRNFLSVVVAFPPHSCLYCCLMGITGLVPTVASHWQLHQSHKPHKSGKPVPCTLNDTWRHQRDSSSSGFPRKSACMMQRRPQIRRRGRTRCRACQTIQIARPASEPFWPKSGDQQG
jgi:hypothetical protein